MTLKNLQKAPFPWFGGKSKAAPLVWELLGDVEHYVEPFAGSLAVLLNRPHVPNRSYHSETVNDMDGLLVNAWRAIQWHPEETAAHASWPVSESDLHARHMALMRWKKDGLPDKIAGSPKWCDTEMAGWWLYCVCCRIGTVGSSGPWVIDETGKTVKIHRDERNQNNDGVTRERPHLSSGGNGVNQPGLRERGLLSDQPDQEFHPHTMPEMLRWFDWLSARLRHVRIINGDWARAVTTGASRTLQVRADGHAGIFLDPPYADTAGRNSKLYGIDDDLQVAHIVKAWCAKNGTDPDLRIILAGFEGEHDNELADLGWTEHEWYSAGFLQGGYSSGTEAGTQQGRERLWASPHCLSPEADKMPATVQGDLFA